VCVFSIDFDLLHERELYAVLFPHVLYDFIAASWFLLLELVAWEAYNDETSVSVKAVQFD
jgi:hypothetical protein